MKKIVIAMLMVVLLSLSYAAQASADVATSISGELRLRPEFRKNADFDKTAPDTQTFYNERIRLGFDAKINSDLSGFVQLQDSRIWGADALITDSTGGNVNEGVDLHQAYVVLNHIGGLALDLKVGRQELRYGDRRLIGASNWGNGRAFDAIKLMYIGDAADVDIWTAKVKDVNSCSGGVGCITASPLNKSGEDVDFYGIYSTIKKNLIPDSNLQSYLLYKRDGADANGNGKLDLSEYTIGARLEGKVSGVGVDYTGEFAYQFGDNGSGTVGGPGSPSTTSANVKISAYALAAGAGYTISSVAWNPRLAVEYDSATGSKSGDKDNTFDQLYPTNHIWYGYMDYQGWENMNDIVLKASAKPSEKSFLYAAYHMFSLAQKNDSWYAADGTVKMAGGVGKDKIGQEVDLLARYTVNQNLKIEGCVSEFLRGDFIKAKVANPEDSTWAYFMGTVSF